MPELSHITGVVMPAMPHTWMVRDLMYRPLIAYNIQLLKNHCADVVIVSEDLSFQEVARAYEVEFATSESDIEAKKSITLNGLNPCLGKADLEKICAQKDRRVCDALGNEVGHCGTGEAGTWNLPIGSGLACINEQQRAMMEGYLPDALEKENLPIEINPPYVIEQLGTPGKPKMLFSAPYAFFVPELRETLTSNFDITFAYRAPESLVGQLLAEAEVWVTSTCPPYYMGEDLIACGTRLKVIATPSTGTNHIEVKAAEKRGIEVLSIKKSPVIERISASSEFSLTLLLAMVNQLTTVAAAATKGVWREREADFRSYEFQGKTIGLLGYGRIGRRMARYALALDMNVIVFDPFKTVDHPDITQCASREEVLDTADIVSLHYHLTEETTGQFGAAQFERMRPGSFFLNTARGELVDERAMIAALESGHLRAAAVDVISDEHIVNKWEHPVVAYARAHPNLIVSPHVAGLTVDSESKAMHDLIHQTLTALSK